MATAPPSSGSRAATSGTIAARVTTSRTNAGAMSARTALTTSASITVTWMKILVTGGGGFIGFPVFVFSIAAGDGGARVGDVSTGRGGDGNRDGGGVGVGGEAKDGGAGGDYGRTA